MEVQTLVLGLGWAFGFAPGEMAVGTTGADGS